ncbi:MAG: hypothetical protein PVF40_02905 [Ectothiorhodospiraceae bacterium]
MTASGEARRGRGAVVLAAGALALLTALPVAAGPDEDARRIYDRLAGVPPSDSDLADMAADISAGNPEDAAVVAMKDPAFYNVTLKNWAKPWTNRDQSVFVPLNDYVATVIGMIRDDVPINQLLSADILYRGKSGLSGVPAPAADNNDHYETLESGGFDLSDDTVLVRSTQSGVYGIDPSATAGVMTSRAASRAFFKDGTNRAMFRFTVLNQLCYDLETLKDNTRPPDRVRQDVSRSPGGDSRIFLNNCAGCHTGMDPMAQAFAYYDFEYPGDNPDAGELVWNAPGTVDPETQADNGIDTRVQEKYLQNGTTFEAGYVTPDDHWDNYWREGPNKSIGWDFNDASPGGSGRGAKSLGRELANTRAFAECQAKKVFRTVCLRPPSSNADRSWVSDEAVALRDNGYKMKPVFAAAAAYCLTGN